MKTYKHNKTGKLYELVQENLLFKDIKETKRICMPDSFDDEWENVYEWRKHENLILYKALYDNPDGPYFVRHAEDFFKEFSEYKFEEYKMHKADEWEKEDVMKVEDWYKWRDEGLYNNEDGCGYYGTDDEVSNVEVFSQLTAPVGMTYVYWFNK